MRIAVAAIRRFRDALIGLEELCETSCFNSEIVRYLGTTRTLM